jgi:hypothetical protein
MVVYTVDPGTPVLLALTLSASTCWLCAGFHVQPQQLQSKSHVRVVGVGGGAHTRARQVQYLLWGMLSTLFLVHASVGSWTPGHFSGIWRPMYVPRGHWGRNSLLCQEWEQNVLSMCLCWCCWCYVSCRPLLPVRPVRGTGWRGKGLGHRFDHEGCTPVRL